MNIYEKMGAEYDTLRSDVGAGEVWALIREMGDALQVLDLGCGTGHPIAKRVSPGVHRYVGIDHSEAMLAAFRKNAPQAECHLLEISQVESLGGTWDLIFSWGALCHLEIEAQRTTLMAVGRMLKPGGRLMFTGGQQAGHCTGSVGSYTVDHYSMGESGYTELLAANGLSLLRAEIGEKDNFTFLFEKKYQPVA